MRDMAIPTLEPERAEARLTPTNLKALLEDMGAQPGTVYPAADLYRRYVGMCREINARPVSKKAFGMALKGQQYTSTIRRIGGKATRCWMFSRRAFRDIREHPERFRV